MVKKNYQETVKDETVTAKAMMKNRAVSLKYSTEICREIRGKPADNAEKFLNGIIAQDSFLPLKRYNRKVGHRKGASVSGVKSGRYPIKTCKAFMELIQGAKANAENKGLDSEKLIVRHCFASQGFRRIKIQPKGHVAGRRRKQKSAHIEIILQEVASI